MDYSRLLSLPGCARLHPRRLSPERGGLAIFALTSIVLLASTPICWNHYFLWTMPAALFLLHRRKMLIVLAMLSLGITAWPAARALGCHMIMAIGLFVVVVHDLWRESKGSDALCQPEIRHARRA